jgi:hypothetical protein
MKNLILSMSVCAMLLLFANCSGNSKNSDNSKISEETKISDDNEIVEIPDANFKAYLLENFDKNNDGNITISEAKAVKEINCAGKNVEDLTGIEKFENLESLDCSNNNLIELEIRYNKKLNKLACKDNQEQMFIYIGMSSPLKNPNVQRPKDNVPPQEVASIAIPLDLNKCSYDIESTNISVNYDD